MKVYLVIHLDAYDGYYGSSTTSVPMAFATEEAAAAYVKAQANPGNYHVAEVAVRK